MALQGLGDKATMGSGQVVGDGRHRRPDTLSGETCAVPASSRPGTGVRVPIVALKPGNAGGAKGCRKVEMGRTERRKSTEVSARMARLRGEAEAPARSYAEPSLRTIQLLMASVKEVVKNMAHTTFSTPGTGWKLAPLLYWPVSPLVGKTTNWRAGCGRSASPVRREGRA